MLSIQRLQFLCTIVPDLLLQFNEQELTYKPSLNKWSKKEIIGHLIDSATNNHQRFIRAQFENIPLITYDQNNWNSNSYYNQHNSSQLISFWTTYNYHLIEIIKNMPADKLEKECNTGDEHNHTLSWLFNDYVEHLEHHLKQILPDFNPHDLYEEKGI